MEDEPNSIPVGNTAKRPLELSQEQQDLCHRLDTFYGSVLGAHDFSPSDMLKGAIFALETRETGNPEWMSQSAHSLREIFYRLEQPVNGVKIPRRVAIRTFGAIVSENEALVLVGRYHGFFTQIAHHNFIDAQTSDLIGGSISNPVVITPTIFEKVVLDYQRILFTVLRRQIEAHAEIDILVLQDPATVNGAEALDLINLNEDARYYFFSKADGSWIDWLITNRQFENLGRRLDPTRTYACPPELQYLTRVSGTCPRQAAEVILETPISDDTLNIEVVNQFLRVCDSLPAEQLRRLIPKIHEENWIKLMTGQNHSGYEYHEIIKTLSSANDFESLLLIAELVFTLRPKEEILAQDRWSENPFYLSDFSHIEIFEQLALVDEEHLESTLALVAGVLGAVANLGAKNPNESSAFELEDMGHLYDVDFFKLSIGHRRGLSERKGVRDLAALGKVLLERLFAEPRSESEVRRIFETYIAKLPDSLVMYRFKLFVISLRPDIFHDEIKDALFSVFDIDNPFELMMGAEYDQLARSSFVALSTADQRDFISKVFIKFSGSDRYKSYGRNILSAIKKYLTNEEATLAVQKYGALIADYEPMPAIGEPTGGAVIAQSPGNEQEWNVPANQILTKLKTVWSPKQLSIAYPEEDFFRPINSEGVGDRMRAEFLKRPDEFLENAPLFFDREKLIPHYTFSFLRAFQDGLKDGKFNRATDLSPLLLLLEKIRDSNNEVSFDNQEHKKGMSWLADWESVHAEMTNVIKSLLQGSENDIIIDFSVSRDRLLNLINYLLRNADPSIEDEILESAKVKTKSPGDNEYTLSDPYTTAINSVRGRAFEAFSSFVYHDGKALSVDVKKIYEEILAREQTQAIFFQFGHQIPVFYFRDKDWTTSILPLVFPVDDAKSDLYFAAWEGYLARSLYEELFKLDFVHELYKRAIFTDQTKYTKRRYFVDLNEGLGTHLSLAYMHYENFSFENSLFKTFWESAQTDCKGHFVDFLGRGFVSTDNAATKKFLSESTEPKKRLANFWDWLLENCEDPKVFAQFGFWIDISKGLFEVDWLAAHVKETLIKSKGILERDYELTKMIGIFAEQSPQVTVEIMRLHFVVGGIESGHRQSPFYIADGWIAAFRTLYQNPATKLQTEALINQLIRVGGRGYWELEDAMKSQPAAS